ncbi:MAG: flagellar biosynthesis protein FlhF [Phycisphaerales bacterium]
MQTRNFRAPSMSEALAMVKRELGSDAVIVSTRTMRRGGVIGIGARSVTEISAHANVPAAPVARSGHPRLGDPVGTGAFPARGGRDAGAMGAVRGPAGGAPQSGGALAFPGVDRVGYEAGAGVGVGVGAGADPMDDSTALFPIRRESQASRLAGVGSFESRVPARIESAARPLSPDAVQLSAGSASVDPALREELTALKSMMGRMLRGNRTRPQPRMSDPLFEVYMRLIESEVADEIADEVIGEVRDALDAAALGDPGVVREAVIERLTRLVPTSAKASAIERDPRGRAYTIAFIGPTGVGKTTTLAKLAATLKLREGKKVGLITCDTYRIAAVDQLRTYASIIGLPIRVALTPGEVEQACEALSDCDAILIDTAGRSPRDLGRIEELQRFVNAGRPHEVHLVLSSASSVSVLDEAVERFGRVGPDHVIFTKVDEAVNFGVLLGVIGKINAKLSFITTGQEVPEHIERCDPRRIAELVLGGERVA